MLNKMAISIAQSYYAQSGENYDKDDIEFYAYGFQVLFMNILDITAVIILGGFIGLFFETIVFLSAFASLRAYAGGHHASTPLKCFLSLLGFYALMLIIIYFTPVYFINYVSLLITWICIFPVLKFAPAINENRPVGPIQYSEFRKKTVLILLVQTSIITLLSALCIVLPLSNKASYICLSFSIGQFVESVSIVIAKTQSLLKKGGEFNEIQSKNG